MIYLSICIPTYQRIDITRNTIASIYAELDDVDSSEFEVIVSDNDKLRTSQIFEREFPYDNFHYVSTDCEGFLNSFFALGYGRGLFLKLHNNYTMLKKGTLKYLIDQIKSYQDCQPEVFFTNGLCGIKEKREYGSFDKYMAELSYFSSWSAGFGIWKSDYDRVKNEIKVDRMFPQTSLFLTSSQKSLFVLNDENLFDDQKIPKKGGYNPYKVFGIDYLNLINIALEKEEISQKTFVKIKKKLLRNYLATRYFKTVIARMDKFEYDNIKEYLTKFYGKYGWLKMYFYVMLTPFKFFLGKIRPNK